MRADAARDCALVEAARIEAALEAALPPADAIPQRLHAAMRYAALGGGKRLRARLVLAAGAAGMCGGQQLDMDATGRVLPLAALEELHARKTGALIVAATRMGALLASVDAATVARLDAFAADLGLAFQVRDDILDVEADSATLGKTAGKDAEQGKSTFPALLGIDGAKARLAELAQAMDAALAPLGARAAALRGLAGFTVARTN